MVLQGGAILFVVRKKPGACSVATWCAAFFHFILPAFLLACQHIYAVFGNKWGGI
jgi:hypothetical protein